MRPLYNIYQTLEVPFFRTDMKIRLAKFGGNWLPSYADGRENIILWQLTAALISKTGLQNTQKRYLWSIEKEKGRLRFFLTMDSAGGAEVPKAPPPPP